MKIIEINESRLIEIMRNKKDIIGQGQFGILHHINENEIYKIYYRIFYQKYLSDNYEGLSRQLFTYSVNNPDPMFKKIAVKIENNVNTLVERGRYIKGSRLPNGAIMINGTIVGVTEKYLDNYINLGEYFLKYPNDTKELLEIVKEQLEELISYYIFPTDFKGENIMINPNTKEIKLIDLDDRFTKTLNIGDDSKEAEKWTRLCFNKYVDKCLEKNR